MFLQQLINSNGVHELYLIKLNVRPFKYNGSIFLFKLKNGVTRLRKGKCLTQEFWCSVMYQLHSCFEATLLATVMFQQKNYLRMSQLVEVVAAVRVEGLFRATKQQTKLPVAVANDHSMRSYNNRVVSHLRDTFKSEI